MSAASHATKTISVDLLNTAVLISFKHASKNVDRGVRAEHFICALSGYLSAELSQEALAAVRELVGLQAKDQKAPA